MKGLSQAAGWLIFDVRCALGMAMLRRVLRVLPVASSLREGIVRGMVEQRAYDRYAGYTAACGGNPLPFDRWREAHRWVRTRPVSRCKVSDASRIHLVRETA